MNKNNRLLTVSFPALLTGIVGLSLGACQPVTTRTAYDNAGADIQDARKLTRAQKIDAALARAAEDGAEKGQSRANLASLERAYKSNSADPETVIRYARALRESDYLNRALIILAPLAGEEDAPSMIVSEYAAVNLGMGHYEEAEDFARKAILSNPDNYHAFHVLGIALDAMGHHQQAEVAFRRGLDNWEGDPTPIMNNLALNLASQGLLDEAVEILNRAAAAAPHRPEIERNMRIVKALQSSVRPNRPGNAAEVAPEKMVLPPKKPERES